MMATMPPLPPNFENLEENTPTYPQAPEGARRVMTYLYWPLWDMRPGDTSHTIQLDFVSVVQIPPWLMRQALEHVAPMFLNGGEELALAIYWEKQEFDITIPSQFCLFGYCWNPPWAGQTVLVVYRYRLWMMTRITSPEVAPSTMAARPFLGPAAIIAIAIAIVMVLGAVVAVQSYREGKIKWPDLQKAVEPWTPGGALKPVTTALIWGGLGLGLMLIGVAILLPPLSTKLGVKVPLGPTRLEAEARAGPQPRERARRRS